MYLGEKLYIQEKNHAYISLSYEQQKKVSVSFNKHYSC